jgi:rhodanese-related sulfurtransferase
MRKGLFVCMALVMFTAVSIVGPGSAVAFECITAQEAYDMVSSGQATLIDVRTLEECLWVGSPALEPGGNPIAYVIPWQITTISETGSRTTVLNPNFNALVQQTFPDTSQTLITLCRSGHRSTYSAERLESLGYNNVYEIDNILKEAASYPGGCGGFQGSNYGDAYNGYRGYPERLPVNKSPWKITVETNTANINNPEDSVSWMDTGLPITQKINQTKIPQLPAATIEDIE